ncbi:MAG TPA: putative zinc-binding protein [Burkholderiales bacterium]|nr:putative zinc-binding protein [Burkholderiales bacterium]
MDTRVNTYTPDFSLEVDGVKGMCPAGEVYAKQKIAERKFPVFSCEGPCIRGEIARQAANLVAKEVSSLARACHAETFFVPHSSMKRWITEADKTVVIDGCFLKCHGRVLKNLIAEEKVVHIDALPLYKKYTDVFLADDVPEDERKEVARQVADKVIGVLKQQGIQ